MQNVIALSLLLLALPKADTSFGNLSFLRLDLCDRLALSRIPLDALHLNISFGISRVAPCRLSA